MKSCAKTFNLSNEVQVQHKICCLYVYVKCDCDDFAMQMQVQFDKEIFDVVGCWPCLNSFQKNIRKLISISSEFLLYYYYFINKIILLKINWLKRMVC